MQQQTGQRALTDPDALLQRHAAPGGSRHGRTSSNRLLEPGEILSRISSIGAGVHVQPHSHANEQIVWMLKGKMEFRLGSEQRVCGRGDVVVIPGGAEHEAWFREDTEVIDFFAPPREDFLRDGKPDYMDEG
jgi:quercetin dioxygenase-like cupin family protein